MNERVVIYSRGGTVEKNTGILCFLAFIFIVTIAGLTFVASNISNVFATATPTSTTTFIPRPSATFTPTPTVARAGAADRDQAGTATEVQSDGSILFIDYDKKYQLTLPKDWVVFPKKMISDLVAEL